MSARGRILFVAGTGTDVGKTHVTCALIGAARAADRRVAALKPVVTGPSDDADRHARALGTAASAPLYRFARAISPHLASREEGVVIDVDRIVRAAFEAASAFDLVVVEGAGGLFSPLGTGADGATLASALGSPVVLVAPDRIGVLHDLAAARGAARARGLVSPAVVLSTPAHGDESTGTNAVEARSLGIADVIATFPRAAEDDPSTLAAARRVLAWLDQSPPPSGGGRP